MVPCDSSESKVTNYWTQKEKEKDLKTVAGNILSTEFKKTYLKCVARSIKVIIINYYY